MFTVTGVLDSVSSQVKPDGSRVTNKKGDKWYYKFNVGGMPMTFSAGSPDAKFPSPGSRVRVSAQAHYPEAGSGGRLWFSVEDYEVI